MSLALAVLQMCHAGGVENEIRSMEYENWIVVTKDRRLLWRTVVMPIV
jgi:hypothetical protein